MHIAFFAVLLFLGFAAGAQKPLDKNDLEALKDRLEGNFDNGEQAGSDKSCPYLVLHIKEIRLKGKNPAGYWLYAELDGESGTPVRQYIYHLSRPDDETLLARVYGLNVPERFASAWSDPSLLKKITRDSLLGYEGCAIYLYKDAQDNYYGGTAGKDCMDVAGDAAYTARDVVVYPNLLINREKGFNGSGDPVWEAPGGGYRFRKFTSPRKPKDR